MEEAEVTILNEAQAACSYVLPIRLGKCFI